MQLSSQVKPRPPVPPRQNAGGNSVSLPMSMLRGHCLRGDFERVGIHHHHKPFMSTSSSSISFDVNEFTAKRVLVTGGTKGAGKAIADRFRRGGATVIITARSAPEDKTENHFIQADLSTPEGTTKVSKQILDTFKGVDIVIQKRTKNESKTLASHKGLC